ncbi:phosphatidate cytidylyltransferase [Novosphingobium sp.]|uniref:phosphatidate cytidylyltransferase n=1 Tax=Novosphingobium sp. TaxID=1874826 RepID=UPI0035AE83BD
MADAEAAPKKSDLKVRAASAVVMIAIAGLAIWLGGWFWFTFVGAAALGVLWEWWGLVRRFSSGLAGRVVWMVGGVAYIGLAASMLALLRDAPPTGWLVLMIVMLAVILTDIGAYFSGRAIGGPKIAPSISPSKTWAGLGGGILGASLGVALAVRFGTSDPFAGWVNAALAKQGIEESYAAVNLWPGITGALVWGLPIAVVAQAGDFFESWMKRRAGVKDSGKLIPGHGGLFDRVDGLLAVMFGFGLLSLQAYLAAL